MVKRDRPGSFVYRDLVWQGCDLLGVGVSSFGHLRGVHYQNVAGWDNYLDTVESDALPIDRAFTPDSRERLTRELILQLKLGHINADYFRQKFSVDIFDEFEAPLKRLSDREMLVVADGQVRLSRAGLLRVDSLLPEFYATQYQNSRYT